MINGNINLSCDFSHSNTLNSTNFTTHQWNSIPSLQVEESLVSFKLNLYKKLNVFFFLFAVMHIIFLK